MSAVITRLRCAACGWLWAWSKTDAGDCPRCGSTDSSFDTEVNQ